MNAAVMLLAVSAAAAFATVAAPRADDGPGAPLALTLRSRVQPFKGRDDWTPVTIRRTLDPAKTAVVICDVWDRHWCAGATRRCGELAHRIAPVVEALRARGVTIVHCPSECMKAYEGTPQRRRMQQAPHAAPPPPLALPDPPLPIDDSDGGCDDQPPCRVYTAWTRENPAIHIAPEDGVSDSGAEVYNFLRSRDIDTLLVMGVHTNMCVLNRPFAIKQMTRWGVRCILVRDLTDTMYNPRMRPFVPHDQGTALVVEHVEKYWCPTVDSRQLLARS